MLTITDLFLLKQLSTNYFSIVFYPAFYYLLPPMYACQMWWSTHGQVVGGSELPTKTRIAFSITFQCMKSVGPHPVTRFVNMYYLSRKQLVTFYPLTSSCLMRFTDLIFFSVRNASVWWRNTVVTGALLVSFHRQYCLCVSPNTNRAMCCV